MSISDQTKIPVSLIDDPKIVLRFVDTQSVEYHELKDSIARHGVLKPILVRPRGDRFELVDGWYRLSIARELDISHIDCMVREIPDEMVLIIQIQCNAVKHETEHFEYAKAIRKIIRDNPDMSLRQIAQMINKGSTWVANVLKLTFLHPQAEDLVLQGKIPLSNAYKLSKLPMPIQEEYIEEAVCMNTKDFSRMIGAVIKEFKDGKSNDYIKKMYKDVLNFKENPFPKMKALSQIERFIKKPPKEKIKERIEHNKSRTKVDAFLDGVKFVIGMDDCSIEERAKKFDEMTSRKDLKRLKENIQF